MLVGKGEEEFKGKKEFKINTIGSCFLEAITFFYIINSILCTSNKKKWE